MNPRICEDCCETTTLGDNGAVTMSEDETYRKFDHDAYARSREADDFWGQIRRTVQGVPVSDDQIALIVDTIREALRLGPDDTLLDIACGNGALSQLLFGSCARYLGVDDYVSKPFSMEQLLERSCELLGGEYIDPQQPPG